MRVIGVAVLSALSLSGCSSGVAEYAGQPGAQAAYDKCWEKAYALPITQQAGSSPFLVAAMEGDYVDQCMRAAGFRPGS
jgi:hypothetical protein